LLIATTAYKPSMSGASNCATRAPPMWFPCFAVWICTDPTPMRRPDRLWPIRSSSPPDPSPVCEGSPPFTRLSQRPGMGTWTMAKSKSGAAVGAVQVGHESTGS